MKRLLFLIPIVLLAFFASAQEVDLPKAVALEHPAIVTQEFIYDLEDAPTPECHASTVEVSNGIVIASWFGGTKEKNKDVGIWVSRKSTGAWSTPKKL
ncbi:hypothetical protein [Maribacter halichondriae]|uniref:hypothetical protein n=1 Tax=Maribacter halichondriae TaxID=2980554 RepID=UPI0023587CEB|nr:hypothetical protein [Maribacter sp. Hal144]